MKNNVIDRIGEKYATNEGYEVEIIEYYGARNCTIKFIDGNIIKNKEYRHVKLGQIKNPYHKSVFGIGFIGVGKYSTMENGKRSKTFRTWKNMLSRIYNKNLKDKFPTYEDVIVCEEWYNFQNFAQWFENNYKEEFHLDKDILIKGNKAYSPKTCCFVPQEINKLFTKCNKARGLYPIGVHLSRQGTFRTTVNRGGEVLSIGTFNTSEEAFQAYKEAKESYIKEVADIWKEQIDQRVYEAMYNYEVEITD